ncbi:Eco47II family restriction endonuclease [Gloeocapsa sp. BRSZ]
MVYLPYISDNDLRKAVKRVVDCILSTQQRQEAEMYRNVIDPFSAIFDGAVQGFSLEDWLQKERSRQIQKTVQNQIGHFHENILSSVPGWQKLRQGVDICNEERKIIAEIKNKYNTVKGSDKVGIYDYFLSFLEKPQYHNFTAYYVEIIPKNRGFYDKPFAPSSRDSTRRPANENIRQISGQAFYDLATGTSGALSMLFNVLPDVISEVSGIKALDERQKATFRSLFDKAY